MTKRREQHYNRSIVTAGLGRCSVRRGCSSRVAHGASKGVLTRTGGTTARSDLDIGEGNSEDSGFRRTPTRTRPRARIHSYTAAIHREGHAHSEVAW